MSLFNKVLSSIGIGAAKIDTLLDTSAASPGQEITGTVQIIGGQAEQSINKINLHVMCNYLSEVEITREEDGETITDTQVRELEYLMADYQLCDDFVIRPGEERALPFSLVLPEFAPLSLGQSKTWITSHLDIAMAVDKRDRDYVEVVAHPLQRSLFEAIESLGFELVEVECEGSDGVEFNGVPYAQEFEFKPVRGDYRGKLDELELITFLRGGQLEVLFEIDRKARGIGGFFREMFDRDQARVSLLFGHEQLDELVDIIDEMLQHYS